MRFCSKPILDSPAISRNSRPVQSPLCVRVSGSPQAAVILVDESNMSVRSTSAYLCGISILRIDIGGFGKRERCACIRRNASPTVSKVQTVNIRTALLFFAHGVGERDGQCLRIIRSYRAFVHDSAASEQRHRVSIDIDLENLRFACCDKHILVQSNLGLKEVDAAFLQRWRE